MAGKKKQAQLTPEEKLQQALVPEDEQPYKVPANWCWVKAGIVTNIFNGNSINEKIKAEKYYGKKEGLIFIATKDNVVNYETNVKITDYQNFKIAPANTALLCIEGGSSGRKVGFVDQNVCFGNKLCAFASNIINSKFIYYILQSQCFYDQFNNKRHGLIGGVSIKDLAEMYFMIPPLAEQQRIVERIESLFAKLDEAKENMQNVLDGFETRKAAILHKAFTGELTANWRKQHGVTMDSWEEKRLGEVCKINPSKINTKNLSDDLEVSFFPMASLSEITGEIVDPEIRTLGKVKNGFTNFSEGDVVFAKITPCMENGKSAIIGKLINDIGYGTTEFYVLRCGEELSNKYLHHIVRSKKFRDEAKQNMTGAVGQQRVSKKYMEDYMLNLPTFSEQTEIVRIIDDLLAKEQQAKELAENALAKIELIKKAILARAFRGELGTNNPANEPAVELLKRML